MTSNIKQDLTVIIVSFNSGLIISDNLGDLINTFLCRIIVVDNASTDDSVELLRESFTEIEVIQLPVNIGYGRAANVALERINTKYSLLINPDVLLSESVLQCIFKRATVRENEIAVFSPALKKEDFLNKGDIFVDYLVGAFLLFRMEALRDVGFFDENIFLFYEEKDLELRLIGKGYKLVLLSDIYVKHLKSASTKPSKNITFLRNWHVAWSHLFYSYKHGLLKNRVSSYLLVMRYGAKIIFNLGDKRIKYKARFLGSIAYLNDKKSFTSDGFGRYTDEI